MAQKITIHSSCDWPNGKEHDATEIVTLALDGATVELDFCGTHAAKVRDFNAPLIVRGRKVAAASRNGQRRRPKGATMPMRAWAKERGIAVPDRGRIPASVVEQYEAAH